MFIKIKNIFKKTKNIINNINDSNQGRKFMGYDKFGNKYFEYLEGKRIKEINKEYDMTNFEIDIYWEQWLRYEIEKPYSKKELQNLYKEEDLRHQMAYQYEINDSNKMNEFRLTSAYKENLNNDFDPHSIKK